MSGNLAPGTAKSVAPVRTRFQGGYAIAQTHGGYLTRAAFAELLSDRNQLVK